MKLTKQRRQKYPKRDLRICPAVDFMTYQDVDGERTKMGLSWYRVQSCEESLLGEVDAAHFRRFLHKQSRYIFAAC